MLPAGDAEAGLSEREASAYRYFQASDGPPVSPATASQMARFYLAGKTCEEVRAANPGFSLGQVVAARIRYRWDEVRAEHLALLESRAADRLRLTAMETSEALCDVLAAKNLWVRESLARYLQTGNEEDLGPKYGPLYVAVAGSKAYKEMIEDLLKITGQDVKKVTVRHEGLVPARPATAEEAAAGLSAVLAAKKVDE